MQNLGVLTGGAYSYATGVSAVGDAVVGQTDDGNDFRAFRWTATTGMQSVEGWLAANGGEPGRVVRRVCERRQCGRQRGGGHACQRPCVSGAGASGQVEGLFAFNLPGNAYKQDWLRAAIGVEHQFRSGTFSLMLNGTTEAATSNYWLAANYRWEF